MDLSIIIVTYNSSLFIERCLRSVGEQMKGLDHEVIIVDNGSSDDTCRKIEEGFPEVLLIRNPLNVGFGRANNLGLRRATGEFVLLLNPDTSWKGGDVRNAIRFLRDHPEIGALGCRLLLEDGSWQRSHGHFPTLGRELKEALYLPRLFPANRWSKGMFIYREAGPEKGQERREPRAVDWVSATFFLCPRKVILEIDGFDERYFMYYEDIDLSAKVRDKGKEIYYYPGIEIVHYQAMPRVYDFGESPYFYFDKHFGLSLAEKLRYVLLFKTLLRVIFFMLLAFLTGSKISKDKLKTNQRTFRYHLCEAPKVLKNLSRKKF